MMKKILLSILFSAVVFNTTYSQNKYLTTNGHMSFFSHSPVEDIEATNDNVLSIINLDTNEVAIHVLIKSFFFEKSLMQEHFNENYMESDKYPKAKFDGKITGYNPDKAEQQVTVEGKLTIHGTTKQIKISSTIETKKNNLNMKGNFDVLLEDFKVKIPGSKRNSIASSIKVSFDLTHTKHEK